MQDDSGSISVNELLALMRAMGKNPTEEELLNLIMEVDGDHNGTIEFSEFLGLMRHNSLAIDEEADLKAAFKMFDSNGIQISLNIHITGWTFVRVKPTFECDFEIFWSL